MSNEHLDNSFLFDNDDYQNENFNVDDDRNLQCLKNIPTTSSQFETDLFKKIFDDTYDELVDLQCVLSSHVFTGEQVKNLFCFFKQMLAGQIKKHSQKLFKNCATKPIQNCNIFEMDVDDIQDDERTTINDENNSLDDFVENKPKNNNLRQENNDKNEHEDLLSHSIHIPNIEKILKNKNLGQESLDENFVDPQGEQDDDGIDENNYPKSSTPLDGEKNVNDEKEIKLPFELTLDEPIENFAPQETLNNEQNKIVSNEPLMITAEDIDNLFQDPEPEMNYSDDNCPENEVKNESPKEVDVKQPKGTINEENSDCTKKKEETEKKKFSEFEALIRKSNKLLEDSEDENLEQNSSDDELAIIRKKKNAKKNKLIDDDDETDGEKQQKKSKRILSDDSTDLEEDSGDKKKAKSKRRKRVVIDSDDSENGDENNDDKKGESTSTRKKIRKILNDKRLRDETRSAERAEQERRKRIEEKQQLYNSINDEIMPKDCQVERVILDIDKTTKEVLIEVDEKLVKVLKPHQVDGIKFLFNCTIETIERLRRNNHESGCILAHSMGLGKTLQVIAFTHTIITNKYTKSYIRKILIVVPLNVAKNWANEFYKWFSECDIDDKIEIFEMIQAKALIDRLKMLKNWHKKGGVLILTINLFSQMIQGKKLTKKQRNLAMETFKECLLDPGHDMVVVDEGHLLKNDKTAINNSINQIRTLRRIILTGTPLQNNLSEYFIMVDFVKPNLLGTKKEFKNRFENPIVNGQHIDSTEHDVKLMKKRVHILHKVLQDCIHRCSYNVLVPYLKPKFEFVLKIRLTQTQTQLYQYYIDNLTDKIGKNLLNDFSILRLIWNHPASLVDFYKRKEEAEADSLKDFVVEDEDEADFTDSDNSSNKNKNGKKMENDAAENSDDSIECIYDNKPQRHLRSQGPAPEISLNDNGLCGKEWFQKFIDLNDEEVAFRVELSSKFIILFSILEQCEMLGDKLLIFSQSLNNLDMIEEMLYKKMQEVNDKFGSNVSYNELLEKNGGVTHRWFQNIDYFRIDGKVKCDDRHSIVNRFNDEDNLRARLMLISTKAGGLGINLIGANRCVIFDVSWNPSHDLQAIYRIYRYGQTKPVYIYRFITSGTMENKIYDRQVIKQSMARRVIDEQQITRHFKQSELAELYTFTETIDDDDSLPDVPKDRLLADLFLKHRKLIVSYHEHDSLLENRPEEELTEEERKAAWAEYEKSQNPQEYQMENGPLIQKIYDQHLISLQGNDLIDFHQNNSFQEILAKNPNLAAAVAFQKNILEQQQQHASQMASSSATGAQNYYSQFYKQSEMKTKSFLANRQPQQTMTSMMANQMMMPNDGLMMKVSDENLINFFSETIQHFKRTTSMASQYRNCTLNRLSEEFTKIFRIQPKTHEWNLRFLIYLTCLKLMFSSKKELNADVIQHLSMLREKFINDNNLNEYHVRLNKSLRNLLNQNQALMKSNPITNSGNKGVSLLNKKEPIECIQIEDSDDD